MKTLILVLSFTSSAAFATITFNCGKTKLHKVSDSEITVQVGLKTVRLYKSGEVFVGNSGRTFYTYYTNGLEGEARLEISTVDPVTSKSTVESDRICR